MNASPNLQLVLEILQAEVDGDVAAALAKMTADYRMTWMYQGTDTLFPSTSADVAGEMEQVYTIKDREYDIRNVAESENVVMIEVIESYTDPKTKRVYRTPQIIVLELRNGVIRTGRHYTDPRLSFMELTREQIDVALRDTTTKIRVA